MARTKQTKRPNKKAKKDKDQGEKGPGPQKATTDGKKKKRWSQHEKKLRKRLSNAGKVGAGASGKGNKDQVEAVASESRDDSQKQAAEAPVHVKSKFVEADEASDDSSDPESHDDEKAGVT